MPEAESISVADPCPTCSTNNVTVRMLEFNFNRSQVSYSMPLQVPTTSLPLVGSQLSFILSFVCFARSTLPALQDATKRSTIDSDLRTPFSDLMFAVHNFNTFLISCSNTGNLAEFLSPIRVDASAQNRAGAKRPAPTAIASSYERLSSGLSSSSSPRNPYVQNVYTTTAQRGASNSYAGEEEEDEAFTTASRKRAKTTSQNEVRPYTFPGNLAVANSAAFFRAAVLDSPAAIAPASCCPGICFGYVSLHFYI